MIYGKNTQIMIFLNCNKSFLYASESSENVAYSQYNKIDCIMPKSNKCIYLQWHLFLNICTWGTKSGCEKFQDN